MESNKDNDPNWPSPEEAQRVRDRMQSCAVEIAKTMFKHSNSSKVGVLAVMMVAAGSARATGLDKHTALDMFLTFYNDATSFMIDE